MKGFARKIIYIVLSITGIFCFEYMLIMTIRGVAFPPGGRWHSATDYAAFFGFASGVPQKGFGYFLVNLMDGLTSTTNDILGGIIIGYAVIVIGFLVSGIIINRAESSGLRFMAFLTVLIPMAAVIVAFLPFGVFRILFELPAVMILYLTGVFAYAVKRMYLLNKVTIITGGCFIALSMIVTYYVEAVKPMWVPSLLMGYIFLAVSLVMKNQEHIGVRMGESEKEHGDMKNIRRYNLLLVSIFFVVLLLAFNLRPIIEFIISTVGSAVRAVIVFIGGIIQKVIDFLYSIRLWKGDTNNDYGPNELGPMEDVYENPFGRIVLIIIFSAVVLYALIKLIPLIYRKIKKLIAAIAAFLRRMFAPIDVEEEYFTDTVEIITPEGKKRRKDLFGESLLRRKMKELQRMQDASEKVRLMYGIIMFLLNRKLASQDDDITKSDTTGEILAKANGYFDRMRPETETETEMEPGSESKPEPESMADNAPVKDMTELTSAYDRVRYGDGTIEANECAQLQISYDSVRKVLQ